MLTGQWHAVVITAYAGEKMPGRDDLGIQTQTQPMNALNLKAGYAVDAQFALPGEVWLFVHIVLMQHFSVLVSSHSTTLDGTRWLARDDVSHR